MDHGRRWRWGCWICAVVGLGSVLAVLVWGAFAPAHDPEHPPRGALAFIHHFVHYGVYRGWTAGDPVENRAFVPPLRPGDVVLCRNPHAVYGYWSHVTMVLPNGQILSQDLMRGMGVGSPASLGYYSELRVLRPGDNEQRASAARAAAGSVGGMFNLLAHPDDPRQWSCARVVRAAYAHVGITLDDGRFWVTPDAIAAEPAP